MKPPGRKSSARAVATGETWFVRLPKSVRVTCVVVDELTAKTIVLEDVAELGAPDLKLKARYERGAVKFVEKVK